MNMAKIWKILTRKKVIEHITAEESKLSRILNTFDLTALGVGSTLGVGVYVLAGHVAKDTAGPSVVLSFFIAALASIFAGLCYAEFGARAPKAGSAYIYSYVCVGEFVAFVIGWNLILEYVIGSASVARGMTEYVDMLLNNTLENTFTDIAPINIPYLSKYFDFFSFGISVLLSIALAFGLKESSLVNNIFTTVNIFVVLFVIIAGSIKADTANWSIQPNSTTNSTIIGKGGFFPFGVEGMIKGAATCFYGFVGFDCIATTGEEVKNPKKAIPISIILSLFIVFLSYFGTSAIVTLMVPYYLQNANAPIPFAFEHIGWEWAKWIVSIGGIFGLCASLFGAMFPLPRIIYAMANDSLVFKFLGRVSPRFHTPVIGTLLEGLLTGLMAAIFDLKQLVNMMSIGTLLAYTIVAACVLRLRYSDEQVRLYRPVQVSSDSDDSDISGFTCVFIGLCVLFWKNHIVDGDVWAISVTSGFVFIAVILVMSMATQPTSKKELSFKVPLVPLIPAISILINIYLMLMLDIHTWIRFGIWMALGLPTYYFSLRPYSEVQKNASPLHENTISKKIVLNYYDNIDFEPDEFENSDMKQSTKKQAPLPPVITEDKVEVLKIQEELEKLDEMLEEVDNNLHNSLERKFSKDRVSIVSDIMLCEQSVVAVVHRDNVVSPAEATISPFTTISENVPISFSPSELLKEKDELSNDKGDVESVDSPIPPDTPSSKHESSESDDEKSDSSVTQKSRPPTPPPSLNSSPLPHTKEKTNSHAPPPMPSGGTKNESEEVFPKLTSSRLNNILLKPPKKVVKKDSSEFQPGDENLTVTSEKTKVFMENLGGILRRMTVLPNYIPIEKNVYNNKKIQDNGSPNKVIPLEKNDDVIQDSINVNEAKEKFVSFITSRAESLGNVKRDKKQGIESKTNNYQVEPPKGKKTGTNKEEFDEDFMTHKKRMGNVFRSIHLPNEGLSITEDTSRNFKSLGQMNDDKKKHRQAMNEIFKNIELRRKDSSKL
nr:high affinity cationic amino acid transporter 1 [Leptinotarsa decemlineata]